MAAYEEKGYLTSIDKNGNKTVLFPATKIECVDGLTEALANASQTGCGDYINDAGRQVPRAMISFTDDDCRSKVFDSGVEGVLSLREVIEKCNIPYTLAIPADHIIDEANNKPGKDGYMTADQLRYMRDLGVTFSCHTKNESAMTDFDSDSLDSMLTECEVAYRNWGINDVLAYAYCNGIYSDENINTVKGHFRMGWTVDTGINQIPYESYYMKRVGVFANTASEVNFGGLRDDTYINANGKLVGEEGNYIGARVTNKNVIEVKEGEEYVVTCSAVFNGCCYVFWNDLNSPIDETDENGTEPSTLVYRYKDTSGSASGTLLKNHRIKVPSGVKYLVVSHNLTAYPNEELSIRKIADKNTLVAAKKWVDNVATDGGWLIFVTHAWYQYFDSNDLIELIRYIREETDAEIIDVNEAIRISGNVVETGILKKPLEEAIDPYFVVDCYGRVYTNSIETPSLPDGQVNIRLTLNEGKLINDNRMITATISSGGVDPSYVVSDYVDVTDCNQVIISGWAYNHTDTESEGYQIYVFKDASNNVIDRVTATNSYSTGGNIYDHILVDVPTGATTLMVAGNKYQMMPQVIKVYEVQPESDATGSDYTLPVGGDQLGGVKNGGNVVINADGTMDAPDSSPNVDLTGYAKEQWVQEGFQPKGDYLTAVPAGYATEEYVKNKIAEAELVGEEVDLSGYAQKSELPTKVSQLQNDSGYLTAVPDGYAKVEDIPKNPADIGAQPAGNYALKTEIPSVPVQSVNGKTGAVKLSASDVGARSDSWIPTAQEVGALPNTYTPPNQTAAQVGADPKGTAASAVSEHNVDTDSHNDIRLALKSLSDRLTAFFDSDDTTLDELSEIVSYITSNKTLIDSITTNKVNVADIVNNLTTNVANKPLSAAQGVVLKGLIDTLNTNLGNYALKSAIPTKISQLTNDSLFATNDAVNTVVSNETTARKQAIAELEAKMEQQTLNFAEGETMEEALTWLKENGDTGKVYIMPDNYFYHCVEKVTPGGTVPNFTNVLDTATISLNDRYSLSTHALKGAGTAAGFIAIDHITVHPGQVIRVNKADAFDGKYSRIIYYDSASSPNPLSANDVEAYKYAKLTKSGDVVSFVAGYYNMTSGNDSTNTAVSGTVNSVRLNLYISGSSITEADLEGLILTVDEPIEYSTTEGGTELVWESTGHSLIATDYEDRILALESAVGELEGSTGVTNASMAVYAPSPQLPADGSETADFNAETITCQNIYDYIDALVAKYPKYITKETMGKDQSGEFDWNRYTCCRRYYEAWQKENYPKMYGWVNGSTVIYSRSVSPRIGDTMYSTAYIGTAYSTVTAVDNAAQARTVNGKVFTRDSSKDVEPTLIYSVMLTCAVGNSVYNSSKAKVTTISSITSTTLVGADGITYTRYPLGDRNANFVKPKVIVIGSNEHGRPLDPAEPAIITARMIKDLCECVNANNPFLNTLKNEYMVVFLPIINPWGYDNSNKSYYNSRGVNLDRNLDTPGWGNDTSNPQGDYGGSEAEMQYFMNTLVESGAKIVTANHALGTQTNSTGEGANSGRCHYMLGRNNSKYNNDLLAIAETMLANYNLFFTDYGEAPPESYAKTRSYIDWIGAEGGAVEMQAREGYVLDGTSQLHTARILEADYTLHLQFLHMLIKHS